MTRDKAKDEALYERSAEIRRIGNRAVRRAQEENRRLGIASVYSRNGRLYWELPSGEITSENPNRKATSTDDQ